MLGRKLTRQEIFVMIVMACAVPLVAYTASMSYPSRSGSDSSAVVTDIILPGAGAAASIVRPSVSTDFAVQVGSFANYDRGMRLVRDLKAVGLDARLMNRSPSWPPHVVMIGHFDGSLEASAMARDYRQLTRRDAFAVNTEPFESVVAASVR